MNLSDLQRERNDWVARNFPGDVLEDSLMGCVEELGEIAHHILKRKQGIRGDQEMHTKEIEDGVCDLVIFAAGIATHEGFDFGEALEKTWSRVRDRDWISNPKGDGV